MTGGRFTDDDDVLNFKKIANAYDLNYKLIDDSIKSGIASANLSINQNLELLSFEEASRSKLAIAQ